MAKYLNDGEKLFSLASEAAVLGSMMLDPQCIPGVLGIITDTKMMFQENHQHIFNALVQLHLRKITIDAVSLRDYLVSRNLLDAIGGVSYIASILETTPSAASYEYYARQVRDRHQYRNLIMAIGKIEQIPDEAGTTNELIDLLHKLALSVQVEHDDRAYHFKDEIAEAVIKVADHRDLIPTSFRAIDGIIRGFTPGKLIILAGRPTAGKSSLALDIALALGKAKKNILFFSLEMTATELMQRAACSVGSVNTSNWPTNSPPPQHEFNALLEAANLINEYPITIYENIETVQKMHALADIQKKTTGLDLVIIDNVQIMTTQPFIKDEYPRLSEISRRLKRMAIDLPIPILLISHLSRKVDERNNHRPSLSDLRGSGTLEQDSDIVFLLYREDMYRKLSKPDMADDKLDGAAEVIVAKNRGGRTGVAQLVFRPEYTTFHDLARSEPAFEENE